MRLVQLTGPDGRRVALVEEPRLRLLEGCRSVYDLASECLNEGVSLTEGIERRRSHDFLDYDAVYAGVSGLAALSLSRCPFRAGAMPGQRHRADAQSQREESRRDACGGAGRHRQHAHVSIGRGGWQTSAGRQAGVAPEWFYKGCGTVLRAHNEPLTVPEFAEDGGEEPEVAGVYLIDAEGAPRRIGFTAGNEFSDHVLERKNYLYLAASKLRTCAIGPELVVDGDFDLVPGEVSVHRGERILWSRDIRTGESAMCHSLSNIEHHHFKFEFHRRPGDLHIHFFGADAFSFGDGVRLEDGDVMQVRFEGFGRALRNPLARMPSAARVVAVRPI